MSLLKSVIKEMAAGGTTGAHAIGGHGGHQTTADLAPPTRSPFYDGGVVDPHKAKKKQKKNYKKMMDYKRGSKTNEKMTFMNMLRRQVPMNEDQDTKFDPAAVISKLDSAEKQAEVADDTVPFGLKDDEGNIVQVHVRAEQADEFEQALASMLSGDETSFNGNGENDDRASSREIAEVLYNLRGRFEIVDVQWPTITGDEQQEQEVEAGGEAAQGDQGGEDVDLDASGDEESDGDEKKKKDKEKDKDEDDDKDEDEDDEEMEADSEGPESQLQAVIDLLRQQAEAQKADAEAREAEAEREEAKYAAQAAAAKVSQEEQILDMEAYYDKKDKADKEAKQLAKLAKWKHETADDASSKLSSGKQKAAEQQEQVQDEDDETISKEDFADMIVQRLRSNQ